MSVLGGYQVNDRAAGLLEQYEIEVLRTRKGRSAILCDTDKGCLIFKEYTGNESRIAMQDKLLTYIGQQHKVHTESIIPTKEGALFVKDMDGVKYILKTFCEGRECNIYDKGECLEAVSQLAHLHQCMELPVSIEQSVISFSPAKEYEKRNKELKKVRKFLQQKGQKSAFEMYLNKQFDFFLEQALFVTEEWEGYQKILNTDKEKTAAITYCHGDYQYHNLLYSDKNWYIINFEKCMADNPIRDLHLFLRKLLEKSNWSISLGEELLAAYERERPISAISYIDLYYRLAYPEKFWKIVNFYYNSRKAWIPERNQEKLTRLVLQEKEKQHFLEEVFCSVRQR